MYPILFQSGPFTIKTSGLLLIIGLIFSLYYVIRSLRNKKVDVNFLSNNLLWFILISVIFARVGDVLINYVNYFENPNISILSVFYIWDGNLNFYFGLIAFVVSLYFFSKKQKKNFWRYLDIFIVPLFITLFFVSIGDFFSGKNYGIPPESTFWPTVTFQTFEVHYSLPIHPTQFYTAFFILICILLVYFLKRKRRTEGIIALLAFLLYSVGEFFMEFLRGDPVRLIAGYRINQLLDLLLVILVIILIVFRTHKKYLKIKTI